MKLLLFDIDGTLIRGHGRGKRALTEAMQTTLAAHGLPGGNFGVADPADVPADAGANDRPSSETGGETRAPVTDRTNPGMRNGIAGKTDLQFVYESLGPGLADETIAELIPHIFVEHATRLRRYFTADDGVELLPGVRELLGAVQELYANDESCLPAVLTGNIEAGARIKLGVFELESFFALGAYGDEGRIRRELPPVAVERARALTGREFHGPDIVIIGDTPNDIDCGRPLNARTIAVTTGPYSRETLAEHEPDTIFDSLANTEEVLAAIFDV